MVPPENPVTRLLETSGSKGHFFYPGTAFWDGNREQLPRPPGDEGARVAIASLVMRTLSEGTTSLREGVVNRASCVLE